MNNLKIKVKVETIVRTVVLLVTTINSILVAIKKSPIPLDEENVYLVVSIIAQGAASLWAWWKNNSFTKPAIKADVYLEQLKKQ